MKLDLAAKGSTMAPSLVRSLETTAAGDAGATLRTDIGLGNITLPGVAFDSRRSTDWVGPDNTSPGELGEDFLGDRILVIKTREQQVWISPPVTPDPPAAHPSEPALTLAARF